MSFQSPIFLAGLLAAAIPIIIHLIHKRNPRKQYFPAIELLLASVQKVERRWRLRRFLLLAMRVLLLAALALAAAGPIIGKQQVQEKKNLGPQRIAIVIDSSLSMLANYDGSTAFARARTQARNIIDGMGPEDQILLVSAKSQAELLSERPLSRPARLLEKLGELEPTYEYADLGSAVRAAVKGLAPAQKEQAAAAEKKSLKYRVVVLSDLSQSSFQSGAELVAEDGQAITLELIDVLKDYPAKERTNQAITHVDAFNVPGDAPRMVEFSARVQSFSKKKSKEAKPLSITLRAQEKELFGGSLEVLEGTTVVKVMRHAFQQSGKQPVEILLEPDKLTQDDIYYLSTDVRRQVRVLVVDGAPSGNPKEDEIFYLERAIQAGAADQPAPRIITADDLAKVDLAAFDVVILAGVPSFARQEGEKLTHFVEQGGGLLITAAPDLDAEAYNGELSALLPRTIRGLKQISTQDSKGDAKYVTLANPNLEHPILSVFEGDALGGLLTTKTRAHLLLQPGGKKTMRVLAEYENGQPALVESEYGQGQVILLTTSIDRELSDLCIRPAFVPLVRQVILRLGRALQTPDKQETLVGGLCKLRIPQGATYLQVIGPGTIEQTWQGTELNKPIVEFNKTLLPGHYRVKVAFGGQAEVSEQLSFSVNIDPQESDLRPLSIKEARALLSGQIEQSKSDSSGSKLGSITQLIGQKALVGYLLLLLVLAFFVESVVSASRIGR